MVVATVLNLTVNFVEDRLMRWRQGFQTF
jgi:hypothetical protein